MKQFKQRPLSPHLGIYRWQISNTLSIFHRITGFGLVIGTLLITWWMIFAIYSSSNPVLAKIKFFDYIIFKIIVFGWSYAFFYHFSNGIRHLFWDAGYGFELKIVKYSGILVIIPSILFTFISWIIALKLF